MNFGEKLKNVMEQRGMNYKSFSKLLEAPYHSLRRWCVYGDKPQNPDDVVKNLTKEEQGYILSSSSSDDIITVEITIPKGLDISSTSVKEIINKAIV